MKVATNSAHAVKGSLLQQLADSLKPGNAECYYFIGAAEEPDMDELSKADLACLDASIKEICRRMQSNCPKIRMM